MKEIDIRHTTEQDPPFESLLYVATIRRKKQPEETDVTKESRRGSSVVALGTYTLFLMQVFCRSSLGDESKSIVQLRHCT